MTKRSRFQNIIIPSMTALVTSPIRDLIFSVYSMNNPDATDLRREKSLLIWALRPVLKLVVRSTQSWAQRHVGLIGATTTTAAWCQVKLSNEIALPFWVILWLGEDILTNSVIMVDILSEDKFYLRMCSSCGKCGFAITFSSSCLFEPQAAFSSMSCQFSSCLHRCVSSYVYSFRLGHNLSYQFSCTLEMAVFDIKAFKFDIPKQEVDRFLRRLEDTRVPTSSIIPEAESKYGQSF